MVETCACFAGRVWRKAYCNGLVSIRLSVCPVAVLTVIYHVTACDAASVHFGPTVRRTDGLVYFALFCTPCFNWLH